MVIFAFLSVTDSVVGFLFQFKFAGNLKGIPEVNKTQSH